MWYLYTVYKSKKTYLINLYLFYFKIYCLKTDFVVRFSNFGAWG